MSGRHRKPSNTARRLAKVGTLTVVTAAPLALTGTAIAAPTTPLDRHTADYDSDDDDEDYDSSDSSGDSDDDDEPSWRDSYASAAKARKEASAAKAQRDAKAAQAKQNAAKAKTRAASAATTGRQDARWDRLAHCESTQNWDANTGNGYKGGLQFSDSTWRSYGGKQYAPTADKASREQQIAVAKKVQQQQGWNAWPGCSRKLGYV